MRNEQNTEQITERSEVFVIIYQVISSGDHLPSEQEWWFSDHLLSEQWRLFRAYFYVTSSGD